MDLTQTANTYGKAPDKEQIAAQLVHIGKGLNPRMNTDTFKACFGCLDITSLGTTDSRSTIEKLTEKVVELHTHFPDVPQIASICVYPNFVETVGIGIGNSRIAITSVAGGFPSSQTYLEVKMLEAAMAVENGADEIDVVLNVGEFLAGEYDWVLGELQTLRNEIGEETVLKVILETGALQSPEHIYHAAMLAMEAGANFIKTSTGKTDISATPEAAYIMCEAIKAYHKTTGREVGLKVAGGISTAEDAILYYSIAAEVLGQHWLKPELFRIGASSLANNLLSIIEGDEVRYF